MKRIFVVPAGNPDVPTGLWSFTAGISKGSKTALEELAQQMQEYPVGFHLRAFPTGFMPARKTIQTIEQLLSGKKYPIVTEYIGLGPNQKQQKEWEWVDSLLKDSPLLSALEICNRRQEHMQILGEAVRDCFKHMLDRVAPGQDILVVLPHLYLEAGIASAMNVWPPVHVGVQGQALVLTYENDDSVPQVSIFTARKTAPSRGAKVPL